MAISDLLTQLNDVKQAIKQAISNKGVNMSNVPFTEYASKINSIPTPVLRIATIGTNTFRATTGKTLTFDCKSIKNYKKLTVDNFAWDLTYSSRSQENDTDVNGSMTKSYNQQTGIFTFYYKWASNSQTGVAVEGTLKCFYIE